MQANKIQQQSQSFPPVVTVLGHVDHGKTTLLDTFRKTSLAQREHGGITQSIGASSIEINHGGIKRRITFIDTPGHEAFFQMRGRGVKVADIALLVVAATDGVMPQTKESIHVIKQAEIPFIVVLTKADLPTKNPEKVKQQLLKEDIQVEGLGGNVPVIEVSAKTGANISELLDLILLVFDMKSVSANTVNSSNPLEAVVIESKRDPRSGQKATLVIKNGTISLREDLMINNTRFRVRTIIDTQGKQVKSATVGEAVEVLGFEQVPPVGSVVKSKQSQEAVSVPKDNTEPLTKTLAYNKKEASEELAIVLCTDTEGALEAIVHALPSGVHIVGKKTGEVTEADILLAKSTGAIVLSFNTKIRPQAQKLAMTEKILAKNYQIIYEMIDEVKDVLEGRKVAKLEEIFGQARILAKFSYEKTFAIGVTIVEGRIARGDKVRLLRGETVIGESTVTSVRSGKESVSKIEKGHEAGIIINPLLDFQVGDVLLCHN